MFAKGSRYRNLPESSPLDAQGERLQGKDLRIIPPTPGRFLHTVSSGDRLDLLAFRYHGDATKWWQIADANPHDAFPPDLLDRWPIVEARLVLAHAGFARRFTQLLDTLAPFGEVRAGQVSFFDRVIAHPPSFLESTVVVTYPPAPATHHHIVQAINDPTDAQFRLLRVVAWDSGTRTAEAFTFDDPAVTLRWHQLADRIAGMPGAIAVRSVIADAVLNVVYNGAVLSPGTIRQLVHEHEFAVEPESATFGQLGTRIVIPPNRAA